MTVTGVAGQWATFLNIGGQPISVDPINIFQEITTREHVHFDLPSINFRVTDKGSQLLSRVGLTDGMEILCGLNDGSGPPEPQSFLCVGGPQVAPGRGAFELTQSGTMNNPAWSKQIWDKSHEGHSSDVFSMLANAAGLQPIVDQTDDKMIWLPNNRVIASYARFVADHGFAQMNDAMLLATGLDGTAQYRSLSKILSSPVTKTFGFGEGEIPYLEPMFTSKAKVYNSVRSYGSTTMQDPGTGILQELNTVSATLMNGFSSIGEAFSKVSGTLGMRVENSPLDSGNCHKNYRQANHQTLRIKGLYGEDTKLMFDRDTGVKLFEQVQHNPRDVEGQPLSNYTGTSFVTGIMKQVIGNRFFQILTITSQGANTGSGS